MSAAERLRALHEAATREPWASGLEDEVGGDRLCEIGRWSVWGETGSTLYTGTWAGHDAQDCADVALIVALRNAAPAMVGALAVLDAIADDTCECIGDLVLMAYKCAPGCPAARARAVLAAVEAALGGEE